MCDLINTHTHARVKFSLLLKIHGPSERELAGKRQTEPVTYGHHNGGDALFDNHPRLKIKELLLDITIVNPRAGSNLGNAARHVGKHLADAVERMKNEIRGSFPATYSLLPLAMSTFGEAGSDVHALIKELVIRRVQHIWTRLSRRGVRASRRLYAEAGSCLRGLWRAWRLRDCQSA